MNFIDRHAYDWGSAFARFLFPLFRKRRRTAVDNILKAGITDDPKEADRIARASWGHLAGHICEALRVPHVITRENWREHLDVSEGHPAAVKLLLEETDKPILLVSAHHGVWEAATNLLSFARPMIAIARVMNNKLVANWMKKHHFRGPVTIVDKTAGFSRRILEQWAGEKAAMTILMDQFTYGGADDPDGPAHVQGDAAHLPRPPGQDLHHCHAPCRPHGASHRGGLVREGRALPLQACGGRAAVLP